MHKIKHIYVRNKQPKPLFTSVIDRDHSLDRRVYQNNAKTTYQTKPQEDFDYVLCVVIYYIEGDFVSSTCMQS